MGKSYYESQEKGKSEFEKRKAEMVQQSLDESKRKKKENKRFGGFAKIEENRENIEK